MTRDRFAGEDVIVQVAWLYYIKQLNQQQIAEQLSISRPKVQRLLERARDQRIIQFYIKQPSDSIDVKSDRVRFTDYDLISRVAWLYYKRQLSQQEIADNLAISRAKVQRLLNKARDQEIIQFFIKHPDYTLFDVERQLVAKYNLKDALVVPELLDKNEEPGKSVAQAGAAYFDMSIRSRGAAVVGVGWGASVAQVIDHFISTVDREVTVATLIGGLKGPAAMSPHLAAAKLSRKMGSSLSQIMAPAVVSKSEVATALAAEPAIREALNVAATSRVMLLTAADLVGSEELTAALGEECYRRLVQKGAVGEILGHFYDGRGRLIEDEVSDRILGLTSSALTDERNLVICVADASAKEAVRGALTGGLIDVLITDEATAQFAVPEEVERVDIHKAEEALMGRPKELWQG